MELWVEFIDEAYEVDPADGLTFGRGATLVVDDANPFMHRVVGVFVWSRSGWWVRNEARTAPLRVSSTTGKQVVVPPGDSTLLDGAGAVGFEAGASNYELEYRVDEDPRPDGEPLADAAALDDDGAAETRDFAPLRLNDEQRALLALLCEPKLREPTSDRHSLPSNAEVAHRLGWTLRKFDRKLDYICRRLADQGLRGVRGVRGDEAGDRRSVVVDHVVRTGLITGRDLSEVIEPLE